MSLAKQLDGYVPRPAKRLLIDRILDEVEAADREALLRALADVDRFSSRVLADMLTGNGYRVSESAVASWRRRNR